MENSLKEVLEITEKSQEKQEKVFEKPQKSQVFVKSDRNSGIS